MIRKNYAAHGDVKTMQAEAIKIQEVLMPLIDRDIQQLKIKVEDYGIEL